MKELEVLSEKDLEYFRKKEEEGKIVIIELMELIGRINMAQVNLEKLE